MTKKETAHERHQRYTNAFVQSIVKDVLDGGGGHPEIMVIYESITFGVMLLSTKMFNFTPSGSVEMVAEAVHQATIRFTAKENET